MSRCRNSGGDNLKRGPPDRLRNDTPAAHAARYANLLAATTKLFPMTFHRGIGKVAHVKCRINNWAAAKNVMTKMGVTLITGGIALPWLVQGRYNHSHTAVLIYSDDWILRLEMYTTGFGFRVGAILSEVVKADKHQRVIGVTDPGSFGWREWEEALEALSKHQPYDQLSNNCHVFIDRIIPPNSPARKKCPWQNSAYCLGGLGEKRSADMNQLKASFGNTYSSTGSSRCETSQSLNGWKRSWLRWRRR
jgi:hypothetical protein